MITLYRSASIAPGRNSRAYTFAHDIVGYIKDRTGHVVKVAVPMAGNPDRVGWSVQYANLGELEKHQTQLMADAKYMDLVAKHADNFVAGSVNDEVWRAI